jgi:hypothetical protein
MMIHTREPSYKTYLSSKANEIVSVHLTHSSNINSSAYVTLQYSLHHTLLNSNSVLVKMDTLQSIIVSLLVVCVCMAAGYVAYEKGMLDPIIEQVGYVSRCCFLTFLKLTSLLPAS